MNDTELLIEGVKLDKLLGILPEIGDKVFCRWGRWSVIVTVTSVTKTGSVYAKRYIASRNYWSKPQRIYRDNNNGIWTTEKQGE